MATTYAVETSKNFLFLEDLEDDFIEKLEPETKTKVEKSKTKSKDIKSKKEVSKGVALSTTTNAATNSTQQPSKGTGAVATTTKMASGTTAPVGTNQASRGGPKRGMSDENTNSMSFSSNSRGSMGPRGGMRGGRGSNFSGNRGGGGKDSANVMATGSSRTFDRHSGSDVTGVKPVMKRDGHGAHNWGCEEDDIKEATAKMEHNGTFNEGVGTTNDTDNAGEEAGAETGNVANVSPSEPILTVEEYLKKNKDREDKILKGNKTKNSEAVTRQPNEGQDPFKGMQAYRKNRDDEESEEEESEEESDEGEELQGKKKVLSFTYSRNRGGNSGGGARGMGGGRGRGGMRPQGRGGFSAGGPRGGGGARGGPSGVVDVNLQLDDDTAFPRLG